MSNKIVFVAVIYNNYSDTVDFCQSLANLTRSCWRDLVCVLVDNSNKADVISRVAELPNLYPFVRILRSGKNLGYFGAFNYFFASALYERGLPVVLCNNDLVVQSNFGDAYFRNSYADDVFVVCPDVMTMDGVHQNPHVLKPWGRLKRLKLDLYFSHYYVACGLRFIQRLIIRRRKSAQQDRVHQACYLHMGIGACYVLRPVFLEHFKQLDYPFFLYGEEAYLTRQVISLGGRLFFDPSLKVLHKESATLAKLPSRVTYQFGREGYWTYRAFY